MRACRVACVLGALACLAVVEPALAAQASPIAPGGLEAAPVMLHFPTDLPGLFLSIAAVLGAISTIVAVVWTSANTRNAIAADSEKTRKAIEEENKTTREAMAAQVAATARQAERDAKARFLLSLRDLSSRFIAMGGEVDVLFESIGVQRTDLEKAEKELPAGTPAVVERWVLERSSRASLQRAHRDALSTTVRLGEELRFLVAARQEPEARAVVSAIDEATRAVQRRNGTAQPALDKFRTSAEALIVNVDKAG